MERRRPGKDYSSPEHTVPSPTNAEPKLTYNAGAVALGTENMYRNVSDALSSVDHALGTGLKDRFQSTARDIIPAMENKARDTMQANLDALAKQDRSAAVAVATAINNAALGKVEEKGISQEIAAALGKGVEDIKQLFATRNLAGTDVHASDHKVQPVSMNIAQAPERGGR